MRQRKITPLFRQIYFYHTPRAVFSTHLFLIWREVKTRQKRVEPQAEPTLEPSKERTNESHGEARQRISGCDEGSSNPLQENPFLRSQG